MLLLISPTLFVASLSLLLSLTLSYINFRSNSSSTSFLEAPSDPISRTLISFHTWLHFGTSVSDRYLCSILFYFSLLLLLFVPAPRPNLGEHSFLGGGECLRLRKKSSPRRHPALACPPRTKPNSSKRYRKKINQRRSSMGPRPARTKPNSSNPPLTRPKRHPLSSTKPR